MDCKNIVVMSPYTLDGAGASAALSWFMKAKGFTVKVIPCTKNNFCEEYLNFLNTFQDYAKIYVIGGYLVENCIQNIQGNNKLTIFSLEKNISDFGNIKVIKGDSKTYTSFLYESFKQKIDHSLTATQKFLLDIINDYVTYTLKYDKISVGLNTVFSSIGGKDRLEIFLNKYKQGFVDFTEDDKKLIHQHNVIKQNVLQNDKFVGELSIQGKKTKIISIFSEGCDMGCVNEVSNQLLQDYSCDVCILVNPSINFVSFRKRLNCEVNLKLLAQKLCNGDGKDYAASGKITETFLNFTKLLKKN